jgi:hypothetical protein
VGIAIDFQLHDPTPFTADFPERERKETKGKETSSPEAKIAEIFCV